MRFRRRSFRGRRGARRGGFRMRRRGRFSRRRGIRIGFRM